MTPAVAPALDEQNPWPGLRAFEEAAEPFFNGRREESAALRRLVMQAPLTVLFGASGFGKTSLIQAGLFPLLRRDVLPVYIRLDLREQEAPLLEQAKTALEAALQMRHVEAPEPDDAESLWEYLHRTGLEFWSTQNQLLTPLFVFDQFEEVFTLAAGSTARVARLRADLADLVENRVPAALAAGVRENEAANAGLTFDSQRYKVLLSFREDFLPAFEGWKRDLPSLMRNRLRLLPMSGDAAFEAVHLTAPHLAPEPIARRIVAFVAAAGEDAPGSAGELAVEPALLSLVCRGLNQRRQEQRKAQFDEALLTGTGQAIVADFYRDAVAGLPDRVPRFIERELITERGFRKPCDVDDARTVHGITGSDLAALVDRRLLRIEPMRGTERVELTHDLLTPVVREHRDRQRDLERREKEKKARRRLVFVGVAFALIAAIMFGLYLRASRALAEVTRQKTIAAEATSNAANSQAAYQNSQAAYVKASRADFADQLAAAALSAAQEPGGIGILFALNAIAVTADAGQTPLPHAEDALRRTVDAMHQKMAPAPAVLPRPGHTEPVKRIEFSPDSSRVATFADDAVKIWDLAQQDQILSLDPCKIMTLSPDWKRLACGNPPFGKFQDLPALNTIRSFGFRGYGLSRMGFSPDGALLFWGNDQASVVSDGNSFSQTFAGKDAIVGPDGKLLATKVEKGVKVWDVRSGREIHSWDSPPFDMLFSPNGKLLAIHETTGSGSLGKLSLLDLTTGKSRESLPVPFLADCMAFSPDSARLAVVGRELGIVNVALGPKDGVSYFAYSRSFAPEACRFATNGRDLILLGSSAASVWDTASLKPENPSGSPARMENADAVSMNSDATVWALASGNSVAIKSPSGSQLTLPAQDTAPIHAVAFSPDASRAVTSAGDARARVWDTATGRRLLTLAGHQQPIYSAAYSPDGNHIATAGMDRVAKLWDARSGRFLRDLGNPSATPPIGHQSRILAVAFSADSKRVLTSGYDHRVILWDAATGVDVTPSPTHVDDNAFAVAFTADGKRLILAGNERSVRDAASLRPIFPLPAAGTLPSGLAVSRDGRVVAVSSTSGVYLQRIEPGNLQRMDSSNHLAGAEGTPNLSQAVLAFSHDGRRLATPGAGSTVRIWDVATGKERATLYYSGGTQPARILAVAFSRDEKRIYAVGENWTLYTLTVPLDDMAAEARLLATQQKGQLRDEDCATYLHQACPPALRRTP